MVPVRVSRLAMDGTAGTNLVVLQEVQGDRMLPIWIGRAEAEAIARHLEGVSVERPLTHDLAQSMVASLGGAIASVRVTHVSESTFFAEIILSCGNEQRVVDARPHRCRGFAICLAGKALGGQGRNFDDEVDAVEKRPREFAAIAGDVFRRRLHRKMGRRAPAEPCARRGPQCARGMRDTAGVDSHHDPETGQRLAKSAPTDDRQQSAFRCPDQRGRHVRRHAPAWE